MSATNAETTSRTKWSTDGIGDRSNDRVVVTGANSGIGLDTARVLVAKGARVTLACRDRSRGEAAAASLAGPGTATVRQLDLADSQSIREFAAACAAEDGPLTGVVANAAVMACPFRLSTDGYELQMATNHLGHALLLSLLWPALAPQARVVAISSVAARGGRLSATTTREDLVAPAPYSKQGVYSNTKQANMLFAQELHRRSRAAGSDAVVVTAHPGVSATELFPRQLRDSGLGWLVPVARPLLGVVLQSARAGAWPTLRALTDPQLAGGEVVAPRHFNQVRGAPVLVPVFKTASDPATAARLWDLTEEIIGGPVLPSAS